VIVGTVKKSMAAMASENVCHRWAGSAALGARLIQRETVISDTSKPEPLQLTVDPRCTPSGILPEWKINLRTWGEILRPGKK
jgi:hypothetical protein